MKMNRAELQLLRRLLAKLLAQMMTPLPPSERGSALVRAGAVRDVLNIVDRLIDAAH